MQLVERHLIRHGDARFAVIDQAAFAAKNLYNQANYHVRQAFIHQRRVIPYEELARDLKARVEFRALSAKVAQWVLRQSALAWKQAIRPGKRTNQSFVFVPHARFVELLRLQGGVGRHPRRRERGELHLQVQLPRPRAGGQAGDLCQQARQTGVFQAAGGRRLNADIKGAYNILRKVVPDAFGNGIGGVVVHPVRIALAKGPHGRNVHVA